MKKEKYLGFAGVSEPLVDLGEHEDFGGADNKAYDIQSQGTPIFWVATEDSWKEFLKKALDKI